SRCPARMHRTLTMARRSKASSEVTDDGRAAHLRNWFFISAPAPSPHVDVPTSPFSIAPPAASAPVAERPVLHWLRADDDVQVATLAGEFAGHVVSDLTTHSAYGPHAVRLGDYLSLIAAKSALKAALAPRIEGEDRLGRRLSRSATDPQRRRRNGYPSHTLVAYDNEGIPPWLLASSPGSTPTRATASSPPRTAPPTFSRTSARLRAPVVVTSRRTSALSSTSSRAPRVCRQ